MRTSLRLCTAIAAALAAAPLAAAQPAGGPMIVEGLPRQADLGFRTSAENGILVVTRLTAGSPAAEAGLKDGDAILRVNGRQFRRPL